MKGLHGKDARKQNSSKGEAISVNQRDHSRDDKNEVKTELHNQGNIMIYEFVKIFLALQPFFHCHDIKRFVSWVHALLFERCNTLSKSAGIDINYILSTFSNRKY